MNIEELKEKARRHELREEWQKAFDLYSTALRIHDEDEPPDITLFNRVGDIQTRLGQINGAVEHYEKAISLYLEAELPNNAIAICKKVLRNLPERTTFFLRMGQIRANQGFLTDARHSFLTYAERQTAVGDIESALNALVEFVEISPEDVEIRQSLATQLEAHGRSEEAVEQYLEVYRRSILAGDEDQAAHAAEKLLALAPDQPLPDREILLEESAVPEADEGEMVLESTSLGGLEFENWDEGEGDSEVVETESVGESGETTGSTSTLELGGMEPPEVEEPSEVEDTSREASDEAGGVFQELSSIEFETGIGEEGAETEEEEEDLPSFQFPAEEMGEVEMEEKPLPLLGLEDEGDEEGEEGVQTATDLQGEGEVGGPDPDQEIVDLAGGIKADLPFLSLEDEEPGESGPALEAAQEDAALEGALEARDEAQDLEDRVPPPGTTVGREAVEDPVDAGDHAAAAEQGDMDLAMDRVRALMDLDPDSVELHQRLVEYAFRKNDQDTLIHAYLELAGCLARTQAPRKAKAVYRQVLSLSPGHAGATQGLRELEAAEAPGQGARPEVASSEEYVDLGSLILGEDGEETTRWTVAADAPSGDEEADFARMLGQFKDKVSEHVAADDVAAHHDLGTAYMEMGLFDEAVAEFQMALRASPTHLPTHEVMGRCWMEMGKPDMAVRALERALRVPWEVEDELIGIYYLMGRAHEDNGNPDDAVEFYEKVFSLDINFEDVTERLRALR